MTVGLTSWVSVHWLLLVVWLFGCLVVVEEVQDQIQVQFRCSSSVFQVRYELIYFWNGRYQSCCYSCHKSTTTVMLQSFSSLNHHFSKENISQLSTLWIRFTLSENQTDVSRVNKIWEMMYVMSISKLELFFPLESSLWNFWFSWASAFNIMWDSQEILQTLKKLRDSEWMKRTKSGCWTPSSDSNQYCFFHRTFQFLWIFQ